MPALARTVRVRHFRQRLSAQEDLPGPGHSGHGQPARVGHGGTEGNHQRRIHFHGRAGPPGGDVQRAGFRCHNRRGNVGIEPLKPEQVSLNQFWGKVPVVQFLPRGHVEGVRVHAGVFRVVSRRVVLKLHPEADESLRNVLPGGVARDGGQFAEAVGQFQSVPLHHVPEPGSGVPGGTENRDAAVGHDRSAFRPPQVQKRQARFRPVLRPVQVLLTTGELKALQVSDHGVGGGQHVRRVQGHFPGLCPSRHAKTVHEFQSLEAPLLQVSVPADARRSQDGVGFAGTGTQRGAGHVLQGWVVRVVPAAVWSLREGKAHSVSQTLAPGFVQKTRPEGDSPVQYACLAPCNQVAGGPADRVSSAGAENPAGLQGCAQPGVGCHVAVETWPPGVVQHQMPSFLAGNPEVKHETTQAPVNGLAFRQSRFRQSGVAVLAHPAAKPGKRRRVAKEHNAGAEPDLRAGRYGNRISSFGLVLGSAPADRRRNQAQQVPLKVFQNVRRSKHRVWHPFARSPLRVGIPREQHGSALGCDRNEGSGNAERIRVKASILGRVYVQSAGGGLAVHQPLQAGEKRGVFVAAESAVAESQSRALDVDHLRVRRRREAVGDLQTVTAQRELGSDVPGDAVGIRCAAGHDQKVAAADFLGACLAELRLSVEDATVAQSD